MGRKRRRYSGQKPGFWEKPGFLFWAGGEKCFREFSVTFCDDSLRFVKECYKTITICEDL